MVWPGHNFYRLPPPVQRLAWEWMPIHFHASGGSTGEPVPVTYTFRDFQKIVPELSAMLLIQLDRPEPDDLAIEWTSRNMNLFPGAPHLAFFQAVLSKMTLGLSSFDTCGGKVIPTVRQVELTDDADALESELFQRTGIKADYLLDRRRPPAWSIDG